MYFIYCYFTSSTTSKHIPFEVSPNCLYWLAKRVNSLRQSAQLLPTLVSLVLKHFIKLSFLFLMSMTFLFNVQIAVTLLTSVILSGSHASTKQPENEPKNKFYMWWKCKFRFESLHLNESFYCRFRASCINLLSE